MITQQGRAKSVDRSSSGESSRGQTLRMLIKRAEQLSQSIEDLETALRRTETIISNFSPDDVMTE